MVAVAGMTAMPGMLAKLCASNGYRHNEKLISTLVIMASLLGCAEHPYLSAAAAGIGAAAVATAIANHKNREANRDKEHERREREQRENQHAWRHRHHHSDDDGHYYHR